MKNGTQSSESFTDKQYHKPYTVLIERTKRAAFHANRFRVGCTAGGTGRKRAACQKEEVEVGA